MADRRSQISGDICLSVPDAIGSCMRELIATDMFGFSDYVGEWNDRADLQLSWAYSEFTEWAQSSGEQHSIRRFARCTFGFSTLGLERGELLGYESMMLFGYWSQLFNAERCNCHTEHNDT